VKFAWSGSGILFRFSGTDASVTLDDNAGFFTVLVDGQLGPDARDLEGRELVPVASGLAAGDHEVRLYRRTEALFGETRFLGVDLGGGTLLALPRLRRAGSRSSGDSITCGYGKRGA
jgi:hypothetical protein